MKIFFDLDGTLLDVSNRHYKVYAELVVHFGGTPLSKHVYWELKREKTIWPELLKRSQLSPAIMDDYLKHFIARIENPTYLRLDTLFPGVLASLNSLSTSHELYLVSLRRNRQNLLDEVAWLKLAPFFTTILTGHSENDGYDVKIALIKKELDKASGIIIGDTEADIITGKELSLTTVAVLSGIRDKQFLAQLHPDYLIKSIRDLKVIITE